MARETKTNLASQVEIWSKYIGLVSAVVSVLTSLSGNPVIAYASLAVLGAIVVEYCVRVIFQKSPIQQAYQVLLPPSVEGQVYSYPARQRREATIWLSGLSLLFLGVGGINLLQTLKPPVTPAREDETLILVVPFQTNASSEPRDDIAQLIYDDLEIAFSKDDTIRPEKVNRAIVDSSVEAQKLGRASNAALVVWGNFMENFVSLEYEIIKGSGEIYSIPLGHTPLEKESLHLEFTLGTEIPEAVVYVSNFTIGQSHYLAGNYENALEYFNASIKTLEDIGALDLDPSETLNWGIENVFFYRGNTFARLGIHDAARIDFHLATKRNPKFADAYNNLGTIWLVLNDDEMALQNFDRAIAEDKDLALAYYNRGIFFYKQEDYEAAASSFSEAIESEGHPLFYQVRADAYRCSLLFELAKEDLTTAIELMRDNPKFAQGDPEAEARALNDRGVAEKELGEYENALEDFDQALVIKPDFATAVYNMAATKALMGEVDAAIAGLKRAIQLNEDLEAEAACEPDFDRIRDHPQMPALSIPAGGCDLVACP